MLGIYPFVLNSGDIRIYENLVYVDNDFDSDYTKNENGR